MIAAAIGAAAFDSSLFAASGTFTFTGDTGFWNDSANWLFGNPIPNAAGEIANFTAVDLAPFAPGTHTVSIATPTTVGALIFSDTNTASPGGWLIASVGGSTMTLAATSGQPVITVNNLGANSTFSVAEIAAPIHGSAGYLKNGTGLLRLSGNNSLTGSITLSAGTLEVGSVANLGASTDPTITLNGGTLAIRSSGTLNLSSRNLVISANSGVLLDRSVGDNSTTNVIQQLGSITFGSGAKSVTLMGSNGFGATADAIILSPVNTAATLNNFTPGGLTVGSVSADNTAPSIITFAGTNNNTSGSNVTVSSAITQNNLDGSLSVVYTDNHTLNIGSFSGVTGGLTISGNGTVNLSAGTLPTNVLTVSAGTLNFSSPGQSSTVAGLVMGTSINNQEAGAYINSGAGTLAVMGNITHQTAGNPSQRLGQGATMDGNLDLGSGSHSINIGNIATLTSAGTAEMRVNAVTSGSGTLTKVGAGEILFTAPNALSATINVAEGTLSAAAHASGNALSSGPVTIGGGTLRLKNLGAVAGSGSIGSLTFDGTAGIAAKVVVDSGTASAATTLHIGSLNGRIPGTSGALTIIPATGGLGTSEQLTVGSVHFSINPLFYHGIFAPFIAAQKSQTDTAIDFLALNGNQIVGGDAVYETGNINSASFFGVYATTGTSTITTPRFLFAIKADGSLANVDGSSLSLGDGTSAAAILNNGAKFSVGTLDLHATESIFWTGGSTAFGSGGTISSAVNFFGPTLTKQGAEALVFTGTVELNGSARTMNVNDGTILISGSVSNGSLIKSGPGNLILTGSNPGFNGTLTASQGTIQIGQGTLTPAVGLGSAKIDAGNGSIVFKLNGGQVLNNFLTSSGTGQFIVDSPTGSISFNNATSNFSRLTIQSGNVLLTADNQLPAEATLTVQGAGTFDLNGRSQTIGALAGAAGGMVLNNGIAPSTLTINIASGSSSFSGIIGNWTGIAINKNGAGTQIFSGSNNFAGGTRLNQGTLQLQSNSAAGTGSIQFFNGGALAIGTNLTAANPISIGNVRGTVALVNNGVAGTLSGAVTVGSSGTLNVVWGGTGQQFNLASAGLASSSFNGTLALSGLGAGTLRIALPANATTGGTFNLSAATFNFGSATTTFGFNQGSVTVTMPFVYGGSNATIGLGANSRTNDYIFGTQDGNQIFNGVIVDGGSPSRITKTGTGNFTLSSAVPKNHSFTGDLRLQEGTFVLGQNANLSGTRSIRLEGGNLAIAGNGTITSQADIQLSPSGVLDVTQVSPVWSTPPTVTISGTGDIIGGLQHAAGTLEPGGANRAGTITLNSAVNPSGLQFGAGVVNLDISGAGTANTGGGTNDLLFINGDIKFDPSTKFRVHYLGTSTPTVGQDFPIIFYTGNKSGWGAGTISTTSGSVSSPFRSTWSLRDFGNGIIAAHVTGFGGVAQSIKWVGTQSGEWDLNFTTTFQVAGVGTTFFQNDTVMFDNAGSTRSSVTLSNAIYLPAAVNFNNGSNVVNYTLSGPGTISGSTGLRMTGTGTVTIQTANTFTGNTTISSGVLSQGSTSGARYADKVVYSPFGLGTIYLGNAAGSATVSAGATIFANDIRVEAGNIGNFNADSGSISLFGAFPGGGTVNLTGNGDNFNIYADNSASNGTINVNGSSINVRLGSPNAAGNLFWNFNNPRPLSAIFSDQTLSEIQIGGISGSGSLTGLASNAPVVGDKSLVIGSRNIDSNWNGSIVDSTGGSGGSGATAVAAKTGVIKTGTASLILTGANLSYTGDTVVRSGVLELSNTGGAGSTPVAGGAQMTGTRAVRVQNGGLFRLGTPGGTLSTAGTITTAATQLLLSVDSGGMIDVSNAYDADFDGIAFTSFSTRSGTTFAGDGIIAGSFRHDAGTISPGRDNGTGKLGVLNFNDALRFRGGSVVMDVGSNILSHDSISAGTLDFAAGTLIVNVIGNSVAANSSYPLMTAPNIIMGDPNFFAGLVINGRGATGTLELTGNTLNLKMLTPATSGTLTWNSTPGSTWDVNTSQSWKNHTNTPDFFYHGDTVTFTNTGAGTVVLASSLTPAGEVLVNSTGTYTFTGPGKITGPASLRKTGSGMLVIHTDNDFTGGTIIEPGGTLALGRNNLSDNNGSYVTNNPNANGLLMIANKTGSLGSGSIVNNGNLVFRKSGPTIVNQNISGSGAVYQADFGVTQLQGTNTWSGGTTISLGTIKLGHDNALPSAGSISLLGTTNFTGGAAFGGSGRGGRLDLAGYAQTVEELNAIGDGGIPGQPMDAYIHNTATLISNISTLTINRTGTLGFNSGIHNGSEGNNFPIGQIALVKQSAGVATMNYTTTGTIATNYSGRTTINGGTLIVRGSHSPAGGTSFGTYTVASGAALAGDGSIGAKVIVNAGGTIAAGIPSGSEAGTLTVEALSLNNSFLNFKLIGNKSDQIDVLGQNGFTASGSSLIDLNVVGSLTAGTFTLVDYTGAYISNLLSNVALNSITNAGTFNYAIHNNADKSSLDLIVTQPVVTATWQVDSNGFWNTPSNWTSNPTIPNAFESIVNFGSISAPRTITMQSSIWAGTLNFTSAAGFSINGTSATPLTLWHVQNSFTPVGINVTQGNHAINAPVVLNSNATINIGAGATLTLGGGFGLQANGNASGHNLMKLGTGTLVLDNLRNTYANNGTAQLTISQGTVRVSQKPDANSPGGTVKVNALSISSGGARLDLTNNSMVIDYTASLNNVQGPALVAQLRGWLNSSDARLYSSAADGTRSLGYKDNSDISGAGNGAVLNFSGLTVDVSSILVRFTYMGDTNVDGKVDISDLYNLASNYNPKHLGSANLIWQKGDFNYDGWVDLADLTSLATNWQAGVGAPLATDLPALLVSLGLPEVSVPEPSVVGLGAMGLSGLFARRRRSRD